MSTLSARLAIVMLKIEQALNMTSLDDMPDPKECFLESFRKSISLGFFLNQNN